MEKYQRLLEIISKKKSMIVAFSGGVDSTLVALASSEVAGTRSKAVMFDSEAITRSEIKEAVKIAEDIGIPFQKLELSVLGRDEIISNPVDRCGVCKELLMSHLLEISRSEGYDIVADGTNSDDPGDYRPGLAVSDKLGIWHPLMEAGIGKDEARAILKEKGVSIHDKPSTTCLMTRIPYDEEITGEKLRIIEDIEDRVRELGFRDIRLRLFERSAGGYVGVLEVDDPARALQVWESITNAVVGVKMALDPRGYRQGSMNYGVVPP